MESDSSESTAQQQHRFKEQKSSRSPSQNQQLKEKQQKR